MHISLESPAQPEIVALINALDAYQAELYPPASNHGIDLHALQQPQVLFAVARDSANQALGCGAIVLERVHGEVKRMYVDPAHRGQGVARLLFEFLERQAVQRGCGLLRLETGIHQLAAIAFYEQAGFQRRPPFAQYRNDPISLFMEKKLQ
jgi:putative acetyltransferase